ncbi:MAG: LCP family protein [Erysipelotrichaceae bacterium]
MKKDKLMSFIKKYKVDILIYTLMLGSMIYAIYRCYEFNMIPEDYFIIGIVIVSLIFLILLLSSFLRMNKWVKYIKRIFTLLLCGLLIFGGTFVGTITTSIQSLSGDTVTTEYVSIIVKKDSKIKDVAQLNNKNIAFQNGFDKENSEFAQKELNKEVKDINYIEMNDYSTMAKDLMSGKIDAMIMTNSYMSTLGESNTEFKEGITVVKQYGKKKTMNASNSKKDITKETFTVFVSGIDVSGDDPGVNSRSDVCMILIVNPVAQHIQMVSFPRDAYVPNTAINNMPDKLTHLGIVGIEETVKTVENFTGLKMDFYVKMNFTSVLKIVDSLGGVDADVELDFCEQDSERSFENQICLKKGKQHLDGEQALAYSRHRHTEGYGDVGRTRAQQRLIQAMINKVLSLEGMSKIDKVLSDAPTYVVTNMPTNSIQGFVKAQLKDIKPWTMSSYTVEAAGDMLITANYPHEELSVQLLSRPDLQKLLDIYDQMCRPLNFSEFGFDLNDLSSKHTTKLPNVANMLYLGDDVSKYHLKTEVEEENPEAKPLDPNKEEPKEPTKVDYSKLLNTDIANAQALLAQSNVYTPESLAILNNAIANAQGANTGTLSKDEYNKIVNNLNTAINSLVKQVKPVDPADPTNPPTKPVDPNDPAKP